MNAADSALAFATALVQLDALAGCHIYAHDTEVMDPGITQLSGEILLPCVCIRVTFDNGLAGSSAIGKAKVEIDVESQSDDETIATHTARETAVRTCLADVAALNAAFAAIGTVSLKGRPASMALDPGMESRAFKTLLNFTAGIEAL